MGMNTLMVTFDLRNLHRIGRVGDVYNCCRFRSYGMTNVGSRVINDDLTATTAIKLGNLTNSVGIRHKNIPFTWFSFYIPFIGFYHFPSYGGKLASLFFKAYSQVPRLSADIS